MGQIFILECEGSLGGRRDRAWDVRKRLVWALENLVLASRSHHKPAVRPITSLSSISSSVK